MLKLLVLTTLFALSFAQLNIDGLTSKLPDVNKCGGFNGENAQVNIDGCWAAGCGVCVKADGSKACTPYVTVSVENLVNVKVNDMTCDGQWERPALASFIPPGLLVEYQNNKDIWLSAEEKAAIDSAVLQKFQDLNQKCFDPANKQQCIDSFNAWLADEASAQDGAIQTKLDQAREQWQESNNKFNRDWNATRDNYTNCDALPFSTPDERRAKYECIYQRQKAALDAFKARIIALQNAIEFHRLEVIVLVRLSREQFAAALNVPIVAGVDALRQFKNVTIQKLKEVIILTFTIAKLKEKINNAIANKDKALAFVDNIKMRAQEVFQNITRNVQDAVNEIKQKVQDYQVAVRDFIKAYARNALECKVVVSNTASASTFDVKCNIQNNGDTEQTIKNRFQQEVKAVLESQFGVTADVQAPVVVNDPDIQPQSAKRGIQQNTTPVGTQATVGPQSSATGSGNTDGNGNTDGSASTVVLSLSLLAMALFAMLF